MDNYVLSGLQQGGWFYELVHGMVTCVYAAFHANTLDIV